VDVHVREGERNDDDAGRREEGVYTCIASAHSEYVNGVCARERQQTSRDVMHAWARMSAAGRS
jgi:hypothetical protein